MSEFTGEFTRFEGHYIGHVPGGGISVGSVVLRFVLDGGAAVEVPCPFLRVDTHLGIAPVAAPDGVAGLRIDFTRWSPVRFGQDFTAGFPFNFPTKELATRVARGFDADPHTSWFDPPAQILGWLRTWGAETGQNLALPAGAT